MARVVNLRRQQQEGAQKKDAQRPRPLRAPMRQWAGAPHARAPEPPKLPQQEQLSSQEALGGQELLSWSVPARIAGPHALLLPGGLSAGALASWLALGDPALAMLCGASAATTFLVGREGSRLIVQLSDTAIILGDRAIPFTSLVGFWVHYIPGGEKELIFHPKQWYAPLLVVPLGDADPVAVRTFLAERLIEKEVEPSLSAAIARRLGW